MVQLRERERDLFSNSFRGTSHQRCFLKGVAINVIKDRYRYYQRLPLDNCLNVGIPNHFHCLEILIETSMVAFADACFEFASVDLEDANRTSLVNLFQNHASNV